MIFEIIRGGELTGWGKNGPAYFFPGERMGRPILSPGKKMTVGKFRPVTPDKFEDSPSTDSVSSSSKIRVCLSVCLSGCLAGWLAGCLSVRPSVSQSVCLSVCLSVCPYVRMYVCMSITNEYCPSLKNYFFQTETSPSQNNPNCSSQRKCSWTTLVPQVVSVSDQCS